ncbi:hypothetical protein NDU88_006267 [Pleurodeles waltl]|uniref:Uncharacterized protein n=1 Tax=Pleurodeles waltl TaxID=8319 RepID=A0AAV7WXR6_PLEWA|nr:hypothetical protein NDU88_006267 [Pleurodeles waltl]
MLAPAVYAREYEVEDGLNESEVSKCNGARGLRLKWAERECPGGTLESGELHLRAGRPDVAEDVKKETINGVGRRKAAGEERGWEVFREEEEIEHGAESVFEEDGEPRTQREAESIFEKEGEPRTQHEAESILGEDGVSGTQCGERPQRRRGKESDG